jgi:hypothetical protein
VSVFLRKVDGLNENELTVSFPLDLSRNECNANMALLMRIVEVAWGWGCDEKTRINSIKKSLDESSETAIRCGIGCRSFQA